MVFNEVTLQRGVFGWTKGAVLTLVLVNCRELLRTALFASSNEGVVDKVLWTVYTRVVFNKETL